MTMTPLAFSLLGVETQTRRRQQERHRTSIDREAIQPVPEARSSRASRRATSHYNHFQTVCSSATDEPPTYTSTIRQRPTTHGRSAIGREPLPKYECTVNAEAKLLLQLESISPLNGASESEWREVYMVLRGTLLSFHRAKDSGPGRLLRSYTLQHAEVGLAPDASHTVLVPQTRLAHLVPSSARRKAWQKDPDMFKLVRQHILRIRVETDQILLADASEDRIHSLIDSLSAGIDISHSIDERSIPRQCTVPRRRRRHRTHHTGDLTDPVLLAEQERILRDMYPAFAERVEQNRPGLERTITSTSEDAAADAPQTLAREEDEIDLSAIREDFASPPTSTAQPSGPRHGGTLSVNAAFNTEMIYATSSSNFSSEGKWQPPNSRTPQQIQRYVRRCMPVLLAESVRASDILICHGKRVRINWRMELLEEWELQPPSYKSHGFDLGLGLERTTSCSRNSMSESTTQDAQPVNGSELCGDSEDQITPAEDGLANLDLTKITSMGTDKGTPREHRQPSPEIHGVVFCF